jgi:hypothetical protein
VAAAPAQAAPAPARAEAEPGLMERARHLLAAAYDMVSRKVSEATGYLVRLVRGAGTTADALAKLLRMEMPA